jgi:DNA polymerase (family 10)
MASFSKTDVADVLREIAVLLELRGENPFKARAYTSGARTLEAYEGDFEELVREGKLGTLPGFGAALVDKVAELVTTGRMRYHEELRASIPEGLIQLLEIQGLGPKKAKALHEQLGVASLADLERACKEGRVAGLPGFGEKTQAKLLDGLKNREAYSRRHLWWAAKADSERILEGLRGLPGVTRVEAAGSLRRGLETVGDLDFLVACEDSAPVMDWFTTQAWVKEVTGHGTTKSSIRFESGLGADLRVVPAVQFSSALHHFTGSKDHNVQMRQRALARGLSLSEWGITPAQEGVESPPLPQSEEELFRTLGLPWIPPELREGLGEIEAAERNELPDLVTDADLKGAFHNHTNASDGRNTLEEMAAAADDLGWEYLGIADHSKSSLQARGLQADRLLRQIESIDKLNTSGRFRCRVFSGTECDILPDGSLDFPDDVLSRLDHVVASVHSAFSQSEEEMTARILRAIGNPNVTMLGHVTGRLLLAREPYRVDVDRILEACARLGVIVEINANPRRLDLDWRKWRKAAAMGVMTSINPDAHRTEDLAFVHAGVLVARKGWLCRKDVLNTRSVGEVERLLRRRKESAG